MPSWSIDPSEVDIGNKQNKHKYYEKKKKKQSGEEGWIIMKGLHRKVVHLFRKPWKREMKYCAYYFPVYFVLFTKMKHNWKLDGHMSLLTIILEITLPPMQSQRYCSYVVITPQNLLRSQGLHIVCWGAHTCPWYLKDPSKPEQLIHLIISLLKSNRDLFELCQMPWAVQCSFT